LSFPGLELSIPRAEEVWLSYMDERGQHFEVEAHGVLAVIFQHELDHINGVLFIDKVSFLKRLKIAGKLRKIKKLSKDRG
jgi:peptide deformylase